jgi:hypothetical protein
MQSKLPNVISANYMSEWAEPHSQARLKKLTDSLASFRESRVRKVGTANDEAVRDWTNDLSYLKETYWDGSWSWRWP